MRLPTHREDQHDVTVFYKALVPGVQFFHSRDGASSRLKMFSQILYLILLYIGFHGLGLLQKIFTSVSILISGPCMLYFIFSSYLPLTKPVSGIYLAVVILTWVIQWLTFTLRDPTEYVSPTHLMTETDPVSETLCSLVFWILDDGQNPKTQ
jgi:hypothetical protein